VETLWTLQELVAEVSTRIAALPAPRNGQVRAIPDDRTIRYYATIGLLDRPSAMRGRTALYGPRHVAQVVAIKRLQAMGRSLSEIQTLWPTLDTHTLARMSGVELDASPHAPARAEFWKRAPRSQDELGATVVAGGVVQGAPPAAVELRLELAPNVILSLSVVDDSIAISPADVRAIRVAAAPLVAELASRRITPHLAGEDS
jgi:DNA-binding transcriptional MerR regulator